MHEMNLYLTVVGFNDTTRAKNTIQLLNDHKVAKHQISVVVREDEPKARAQEELADLVGRRADLDEALYRIREQSEGDPQENTDYLQRAYEAGSVILLIESTPDEVSPIVHILTATVLPGEILIPPPKLPPRRRAQTSDSPR